MKDVVLLEELTCDDLLPVRRELRGKGEVRGLVLQDPEASSIADDGGRPGIGDRVGE